MESLGEVRSYSDLHEILRTRASAVGLTRLGLDAAVGITDGHSSKLLAAIPTKRLGPLTLEPMLGALGVVLLAVVDDAAVKRFAPLVEHHRSNGKGPRATISPEIERRAREIASERAARAGRRGALMRLANTSPAERSRVASHAAKARWARTKPKQRRTAMARLTAARKRKAE